MLLSNEICWQVAKSIVCCDFEKAQRILCGKHESSNDSDEDGHVERVPFTQRKRKFNGATYSRAPVALDIRQDNGEVAYPSCKKSHHQADGKDTLKRPTLRIRAVSPPLQIPPPPPPLLAKDVVTAASTPSLLGKYDTNAESKSDPHNTLASEQELNTESEVQSKSESTEQRYESSSEETETEDEDSRISDFDENDDIDIVVIDDIEEDSPM
jgi:hypothetical protein